MNTSFKKKVKIDCQHYENNSGVKCKHNKSKNFKKIKYLFNNNAYVLQKVNLHKREDESNVKAKDQISTAHALNFEYVCI